MKSVYDVEDLWEKRERMDNEIMTMTVMWYGMG